MIPKHTLNEAIVTGVRTANEEQNDLLDENAKKLILIVSLCHSPSNSQSRT